MATAYRRLLELCCCGCCCFALITLAAAEKLYNRERIARSGREPYNHVMRARALLAVADGSSYTAAAKVAGRQSGDSVGALVQRFNVDGLSALAIRPGRERKPTYSAAQRRAIIAEVQRRPDPRRDGTSSWSLTTLRRALRAAGLAVWTQDEAGPGQAGGRRRSRPCRNDERWRQGRRQLVSRT